MTTPCNPPEGYVPIDGPTGPYFAALGPVYWREARNDTEHGTGNGTLNLGLRLKEQHNNILGIPHGGMLLTFADGAIGVNLGRAQHRRDPSRAIVTASLTSDFLGAARQGDWLEALVTVRKTGRQLSFGECLLVVGARPILRASAVFSTVERPAPQRLSDG
jgi:acyl-coenzyme A thioesterase 13